MLSYELAKKLKDAGYPIYGTLMWVSAHDTDVWCTQCDFRRNNIPPSETRPTECPNGCFEEPTLEELIEATPRLDELTRARHGENKWIVAAYPCGECGWATMHTAGGDSPEAAVANLWLTLNQEKK